MPLLLVAVSRVEILHGRVVVELFFASIVGDRVGVVKHVAVDAEDGEGRRFPVGRAVRMSLQKLRVSGLVDEKVGVRVVCSNVGSVSDVH